MRKLLILILLMAGHSAFPQSGSFPGKFVHSVYFWLNNPENEADNELFLKNLNEFLENSEYLLSYHVAPPAGTPREVVDNSYDYNLVVTFDSKEEQDKYQTEPAHLKFVENSNHLWDKVQIYDSYRGGEEAGSFKRGDIQIGIVVSDVAASEKFYHDVVGMTRTGGFEVPGDMAKTAGLTNGIPLKVTVMKLKNDPHASEWKLMEFADAPKTEKTNHINEGTGVRYVTFYVKDITAAEERLSENKVKPLGKVDIGGGQDLILIQDPDGIFIELIGPR